jgi:hypothetical protein
MPAGASRWWAVKASASFVARVTLLSTATATRVASPDRAAARITELEDRLARALAEIEAVIAEMAESELALSGRP